MMFSLLLTYFYCLFVSYRSARFENELDGNNDMTTKDYIVLGLYILIMLSVLIIKIRGRAV